MCRHDAVDDGQPETRAPTLSAKGEERLEEVLTGFRRDSRTVVSDLEDSTACGVFDSHRDLSATLFNRVPRVDDQIEEQSSQPDWIGNDGHRLILEINFQIEPFRQEVAEDALLLVNKFHEIDGVGRRAFATGEKQELAHDLRALFREIADRRYRLGYRIRLTFDQTNVEQYCGQ